MSSKNTATQSNDHMTEKKNSNTLALTFIVAPVVLLISAMILWGFLGYAISYSAWPAINNSLHTAMQVLNVLFGFITFILLIITIPAFIAGIIILLSNSDRPTAATDLNKPIPEGVKKWNWAAAFFSPIWGIYYRVWEGLLVFVPLVNIVVWVYLGLKGNEIAWRRNNWQSVEVFQKDQKPWNTIGIIWFILKLGSVAAIFIGSILVLAYTY